MDEALRSAGTRSPEGLNPKAIAILEKMLFKTIPLAALEAPRGISTTPDDPQLTQSDLQIGREIYRELEPFLFDFRNGRLHDEIQKRISQLLKILDACLFQQGNQLARIGGVELFPQVQKSLSYILRIVAVHRESLVRLDEGKAKRLLLDTSPEETKRIIESLCLAFFEEIEGILTLGLQKKIPRSETEATRPLSPREAAHWASRLSIEMTRQGCAQRGIKLEPISLEEVLSYEKERRKVPHIQVTPAAPVRPARKRKRRGSLYMPVVSGRSAVDDLNEAYRDHQRRFSSTMNEIAARIKADRARREREAAKKKS